MIVALCLVPALVVAVVVAWRATRARDAALTSERRSVGGQCRASGREVGELAGRPRKHS